MGPKIGGKIERINGKELSYHEFVENYLKQNQPVLLTGLMDSWKACSDWVNENGDPNLDFFSTHFGKSKVQVADCGRREFTDQKRVEMSVSDFISTWIELSDGNCGNGLGPDRNDLSLLYLKDWHLVKDYPKYVPYTTPLFFLDDWLNLYLDSHHMHKVSEANRNEHEINCSDYRFVYMGPKGTWTPLHADVFRSHSWSANVCGKKLWYLLSPSQSHLLFDRNMKSSVYDIFADVSEMQFPGFKETIWLECIQEMNDIIFVPSGWYHQVHNLGNAISINHNWFNAYNLSWVWNLLVKDYNEAMGYIEDIRDICDDFEGLCQRNLAANTGMNFPDFFIFITRFAIANMTQLSHLLEIDETAVVDSLRKVQHLISNMIYIRKLAMNMKSSEFFAQEKMYKFVVENHSTFSDIRKLLEEPEFLELSTGLARTYETIDSYWEQGAEIENSHSCPTDGWFLNNLKPFTGILDYIRDSDCSVMGPEDLIRIIDIAIRNIRSMDSDLDLSFLSKLSEVENLSVL